MSVSVQKNENNIQEESNFVLDVNSGESKNYNLRKLGLR